MLGRISQLCNDTNSPGGTTSSSNTRIPRQLEHMAASITHTHTHNIHTWLQGLDLAALPPNQSHIMHHNTQEGHTQTPNNQLITQEGSNVSHDGRLLIMGRLQLAGMHAAMPVSQTKHRAQPPFLNMPLPASHTKHMHARQQRTPTAPQQQHSIHTVHSPPPTVSHARGSSPGCHWGTLPRFDAAKPHAPYMAAPSHSTMWDPM